MTIAGEFRRWFNQLLHVWRSFALCNYLANKESPLEMKQNCRCDDRDNLGWQSLIYVWIPTGASQALQVFAIKASVSDFFSPTKGQCRRQVEASYVRSIPVVSSHRLSISIRLTLLEKWTAVPFSFFTYLLEYKGDFLRVLILRTCEKFKFFKTIF